MNPNSSYQGISLLSIIPSRIDDGVLLAASSGAVGGPALSRGAAFRNWADVTPRRDELSRFSTLIPALFLCVIRTPTTTRLSSGGKKFQSSRACLKAMVNGLLVTAGCINTPHGISSAANLVGLARVELATNGLGNRCSIHLSYSPCDPSLLRQPKTFPRYPSVPKPVPN